MRDATAAVDFNGDGNLDLGVSNQTANSMSVLFNTTAAVVRSASQSEIRQFNGDGTQR